MMKSASLFHDGSGTSREVTPIRKAPKPSVFAVEPARCADHLPDGEVVGTPARLGPVAVDEEQFVDAVGGGGEQVAPEPEDVAVPGVQAGDRPATHPGDLVGDGDARHGCPTDVVVRHEKCRGDRAEHADLVAHPYEVGSSCRLDLTDQLESVRHH